MSVAALTETVSEKRRRGRPRLLTPRERGSLRNLFPDNTTERSLQDIDYRLRAIGLLKEQAEFAWLYDPQRVRAGEKRCWKPLILTELGRIADDEELLTAAREVCRLKPKAHDAARIVRRFRIGREPAASTGKLASAIIKAVNAYNHSHDGLTWEMLDDAFTVALDAFRVSNGMGEQGATA